MENLLFSHLRRGRKDPSIDVSRLRDHLLLAVEVSKHRKLLDVRHAGPGGGLEQNGPLDLPALSRRMLAYVSQYRVSVGWALMRFLTSDSARVSCLPSMQIARRPSFQSTFEGSPPRACM